MTEPIPFTLQPFAATAQTAALTICGTAVRVQNVLSLSYALAGDLSKVAIAPRSEDCSRRDRLWEKTCFEFFIREDAPSQATPYWEFNLSPAGYWNVFSLAGYRQGLTETAAFTQLPFTVSRSATGLQLNLSVDLSALIDSAKPLCLGISAVIVMAADKNILGTQPETVKETFWAIAHPGPAADFHHPDSFVVKLQPS